MQNISATSVCIRCGKVRVVSKTWKEKVFVYGGLVTVIHSETICPDKECQKLVDAKLAEAKEKKEVIRKNKEARLMEVNKARMERARRV